MSNNEKNYDVIKGKVRFITDESDGLVKPERFSKQRKNKLTKRLAFLQHSLMVAYLSKYTLEGSLMNYATNKKYIKKCNLAIENIFKQIKNITLEIKWSCF